MSYSTAEARASCPPPVLSWPTWWTALYVRARAQQKQQVISSAEKTFGEIKLLKRVGAPEDEFAFVTPVASERELRTKLETLLGAEIISTIRVTDY